VSGCRTLTISLGLCALAAVPAAAQAGATIAATATVIDLGQAQTTLQTAGGLAAAVAAQPATSSSPARREVGSASVLLTSPAGPSPDPSPDSLLATIIYW
jgi:hypothetical protein